MSAYVVVRVGAIHDTKRYNQYRNLTPALLAHHGARYIVKGYDEEVAEGHDPERFTIIEFPSLESLHTFWASENYAKIREIRIGAVDLKIGFVDGLHDQNPSNA